MICYYCEQERPTQVLYYRPPLAFAICQECGAGVCAKHSRKEHKPRAALLCLACSETLKATIPEPAAS